MAIYIQKLSTGFPGGTVVENLPANAEDMGSSPGKGKIPHATEQLSPCDTTTEPTHLEPVPHNKRGCDSERPHTAMKSGPHSPQLEKALAQKRRPDTAK